MINLEIIPAKDGIIAGEENTFDVLLRASSDLKHNPKLNKRLPLNLSLVIDRSGSMQGKPLDEAKKAAAMLVDRMSENDQLSVVTYDDQVDVVFPTTKVTNKPLLKHLIRGIQPGGMTALYDGWSVGADEVSQSSNKNHFSRVLLLSDGQANRGLIDEEAISSECLAKAENGVTTSTYGLGLHFNERLMAMIATAGQGQSHYGQTAQDLMDPFQEEFDLMEAIIARRMRLRIFPEVGVNFELLNGYIQDNEGRFVLPDLAYGADVWALAKVKLAQNICNKSLGSSIKIMTATIDFLDAEGAERRSNPTEINIKIVSKSAYATLDVDHTVQQRAVELRAASLQEQAHIAARQENWSKIDQIMEELDGLALGNGWIKASLERLKIYSVGRHREAFSKEAQYKSSRMRSRSVSRDENADFSMASERTVPSYLRRKLEQGKKQP